MGRASKASLDPQVWAVNGSDVTCLLCERPFKGAVSMKPAKMGSHASSARHKAAFLKHLGASSPPEPLPRSGGPSNLAFQEPSEMDIDPSELDLGATNLQANEATPMSSEMDQPDDSEGSMNGDEGGHSFDEAPISRLWQENQGSRLLHSQVKPGFRNHADILRRLNRGEDVSPDYTGEREELPNDSIPGVEGQDARSDTDSLDNDSGLDEAFSGVFGGSVPDTFPWPSLAMFLTDALFSSPRLQFSDTQKQAVLSWAEDLDAQGVPKLAALKACQERIRQEVGNPTEKQTSFGGNVFYLNDIGKAIAKDYANPLTRLTMQDYPELDGLSMSEVFHGSKMLLDVPADQLTQTAYHEGNIFYVNELLQRYSGAYFIPERYFYQKDETGFRELQALGRDVFMSSEGFEVDEERKITPVKTFMKTFDEVGGNAVNFADSFAESSRSFVCSMPNPIRKIAGDRMAYGVPLILFMDDVSGNVSKQWNKHHAVYISNANMPRQMIEKEFCLRFVTSSPHASPMQLMRAVKQSIVDACKTGVIAWDIRTNQEVLLRPYALLFAGDNPMQAEECSQAGLVCNFFCRTCKVGGNKAYKQSDEGFQTLFEPGVPRNPNETKEQSLHLLNLAVKSGAEGKIEAAVASNGTKDSLATPIVNLLVNLGKEMRQRGKAGKGLGNQAAEALLQTELDKYLKDHPINPLIGMPGVDIHQDTPTEVLHTVLLGVVKYFWGQTVWLLQKDHTMSIFQAQLASVNCEGLNIPKINAEYICGYSGSLIGKHFKSLAQVMSFLVYDLVPKGVLDAWNVIGDLVVLLWHTKIEDIDMYCADLSRKIEDFLNITATCAPSIIISKPKFHFLVHLPAYIRRFGPAITFSTERYESFNSVFRQTCIYSNRQAPSRDTCKAFASQDIIKHVATGGFWFSKARGEWVRAGHIILKHAKNSPHITRLLTIPEVGKQPLPHPVGTAKLPTPCPASANRQGDSDIEQDQPERIGASPEERLRLQNQLTRKRLKAAQRAGLPWSTTKCAKILTNCATTPLISLPAPNSKVILAKSFVARKGDVVTSEGHAILQPKQAKGSPKAKGCIVQILEVLVSATSTGGYMATHVAIEHMGFLGRRQAGIDLPSLELTGTRLVVLPKDIICGVNVQHDCITSGCNNLQHRPILQERTESLRTRATVLHEQNGKYLLNTHALHNYQHIRAIVPEDLWGSSVRFDDVPGHRKAAAAVLRREKGEKAEVAARMKAFKAAAKLVATAAKTAAKAVEGTAEEDGHPTPVEIELLFGRKGKKRKSNVEMDMDAEPKAPSKPRPKRKTPATTGAKGKARETRMTISEELDGIADEDP